MTPQPPTSPHAVPTRVQSPRNRKATRGFALLLVLGLLSLIVLILVSLAAFTKVETSIAGVTQQQAQARQNAIFAMNQALGLLQRSAGPDQRVTAAASLADPNPPAANINRSDHVFQNWTGVWDSTNTAAGPIAWLVTGNDAETAYPTTTTPATATDLVTPLPDPDANALRNTVWMVRRALTDSTGAIPVYGDAGTVVVPKAEIVSQDVPGFVGTNRTVGRYAFWVADEGVKASLGMWDRTSTASPARGGTFRDRIPLLTYNDSTASVPPIFSDYSTGSILTGQEFDTLGDHNRFRTRLMIAQENRLDQFFNGLSLSSLPPEIQSLPLVIQRSAARENLTSLAQLPGLGDNPAKRAALQDELVANYHSLTPQSLGVLSDTISGGLKRILTIKPRGTGPSPRFEGDAAEAQMVDWATNRSVANATAFAAGTDFMIAQAAIEPPRKFVGYPRATTGEFFFTGGDQTAFAVSDFSAAANANQPIFLRAPIMSQIRVAFRITDAGAGAAQIQDMEVEVELWNPYPVELIVEPLAFTLDGLSGLTVPCNDASGTGVPVTVTLPTNIIGPYATAPGTFAMLPGSVVRMPVIGPSSFPVGSVSGPIVFPLVEIDWPTAAMNVLMEVIRGAGTVPLRLYRGIQLANPGSLVVGDGIEVNMRLRDMTDVGAITSTNDWLRTYDPNSPTILGTVGSTVDTQHPYIYPGASSVSPIGGVVGFDGGLIDGEVGFSLYDVRRQDVLSYGAFRHLSFMPFDLGTATERNSIPYAIGAPVALLASPVIGEAPGSAIASYNRGFDRLYPLAIPREQVAAMIEANSPYSGASLPNTHLQLFSKDGVTTESVATLAQTGERIRLQDELSVSGKDASQWLMVRNSFNINSTSEAAWRALLAGADFSAPLPLASASREAFFRYFGTTGAETAGVTGGTNQLTNAWFRYPQNVQHLGRTLDTAADFLNYDELDAHRMGIRRLSQSQINVLAAELVKAIREPRDINFNGEYQAATKPANAPFGSLAQFVGSGVLQRAIEAVATVSPPDAINPNTGVVPNIPFAAPTALIQQDILERLAPILSARSDTFVIRAYGEAGNPLELPNARQFTVGEAWLEAVVQRCPDYVDQEDTALNTVPLGPTDDERDWVPGDAATTASLVSQINQNLGRRFRVLSVRWLAPDEI